jgi:hypothetical protein
MHHNELWPAVASHGWQSVAMQATARFSPTEQTPERGASARYELTLTNSTDSSVEVWTQYRWSGNQTILPGEITLRDENGRDVSLVENADTQFVLTLRRETIPPGRSTSAGSLQVRSPWVTEIVCSIEIWPDPPDLDASAPFCASGLVILTPSSAT